MFSEYKVILVTGGRNFNDTVRATTILNKALTDFKKICIVQGGARGADAIALAWALNAGVPCLTMHAPWTALGKSAGTVRNIWMADITQPSFVLAFPGGVGTAHMKSYAAKNNIPVYEV